MYLYIGEAFGPLLWKLTVYCCLHIFSVVTLAFDHCLEKNKKELSTPPKKSVTERQGISAFRGEEGGDLFLLENVSNARICFHTLSEGGRISLLAFKYQTPSRSTQLEHSPNPEYHTYVVGPNPIKLRAKRHFCANRHRLAGCHLGE